MTSRHPESVLTPPSEPLAVVDAGGLARRYREVRGLTERLCAPLQTEDYIVQSMPDASPAKWHLAHTSWFFETFVLKPSDVADLPSSREYSFLFNSYYNAVGERIARADRGLISRPTVAEAYGYRAAVDERMIALLERADAGTLRAVGPTIELGLNHEQQHQELILTDIKHAFGKNPLRPVYRERPSPTEGDVVAAEGPLGWREPRPGLREIGHAGPGFSFDNEMPRHRTYLEAFQIGDRPVSNADYLGFMADRGYDRPELWLSDGWNARNAQRWSAPLYWEPAAGGWKVMTLAGLLDVDEAEPVCHVSFYEADAYARWAGARLPREAEWEAAAEGVPVAGNFLEAERFHPARGAGAAAEEMPAQLFGDVWEWTSSPYTAYPGYRPAPGALGEYNGKFMCNQMVLRGGSCATPRSHVRASYRNFFPPEARWQFSGIRLARDV